MTTLRVPRSPLSRAAFEFERARVNCAAALAAKIRAEARLMESKLLLEERQAWKAVRSDRRNYTDGLMVCCAYCQRMRLHTGEWIAAPAYAMAAFHHTTSLSHSFCPDCLADHSPG